MSNSAEPESEISPTPDTVATKDAEQKKAGTIRALNMSIFLSVFHMCSNIQTEPLILRDLCNGDMAKTMSTLGNTAGIVNVLALVINQLFGRLSDSIGRRKIFLLGPLFNALTGVAVYRNPSIATVAICRVVRQVMAGVSSSLMLKASIMDILSGPELGIVFSRIGSIVGLAVLSSPFLETLVLQRSTPKTVYLAGSVVGLVHLLHNYLCIPETLEPSKRAKLEDVLTLQSINPFSFLKIWTRGSRSLQRLASIVTVQMIIEGKNMADFEEVWKRNHLNWGTEMCRNELVIYGIVCTIAGETVHPTLLKRLSAGQFTTVTNVLNAIAFFLRGLYERGLFFLGSSFVLLPGVNGAAAQAIAALESGKAQESGFDNGEYSAITTQLRAITRAFAPAFIGNCYAFCLRRKIYPGVTFMALGVLGAVLPQVMLMLCDAKDLQPVEEAAKDSDLAADTGTDGDAEEKKKSA